MNKAVLKEFAIESRKYLMERVKLKLNLYYVDENFNVIQNGDIYTFSNSTHTFNLTKEEKQKRELLVKRISEISIDRVIEEAAYTWFNRFIAIRYMEIHDFLPLGKNNESLGIRVLSSNDDTPYPEILKFSNLLNTQLDIGFEQNKFTSMSNDNEKFKYILLLVCNKLKKVFPTVFDGITDYIDLLIPENLLSETGFVSKMLKSVDESNFNHVEIIGWLYQYYNQTEKDRVITAKKKYKKHEIAYATQLFTPDWIVKYMVENSLGRYYLEHKGNVELKNEFKYLSSNNLSISDYKDPKDITFIDPCCGSGHVLVYAFEIFYKLYENAGYNKNDIPCLILSNNIYGIDVDDRAGQLSILSVLLKAREYDKNLFSKDYVVNITALQESNSFDINSCTEKLINNENINYLIETYKNAKEIGSLILAEYKDFSDIEKDFDNNIFDNVLLEKIRPLIKQNNILSRKYNIVVTNPPYMNNSLMTDNIKKYLNTYYKDVKCDLFSSFIIRNSYFGYNDAYLGFMTPYVWMFISSYEKLRNYIIENLDISSLIQLEYSALSEATVPICTFVLKNSNDNLIGDYYRLTDFVGGMDIQEKKYLEFLSKENKFHFCKKIDDFKKIPNQILGYWLSENLISTFEYDKVLNHAEAKQGMTTSDNNRFLRLWWEVDYDKIGFGFKNIDEAGESEYKWFPYNKGGEFRKWYGNNDYVVNYYHTGEEMEAFHKILNETSSGGRIKNKEYYFKHCITWSKISSGSLAFRYKEDGYIFDVAGSCIFCNDDDLLYYLLALYNSKLGMHIIGQISPTLNFEAEQIKQMPLVYNSDIKNEIIKLTKECINIEKENWDIFENSWNFDGKIYNSNYPIKIVDLYNKYVENHNDIELKLKSFETRINELLISAYNLNEELTYDVSIENLTLKKHTNLSFIKGLISYIVGCIFGRYNTKNSKLMLDNDNIIPLSEDKKIYYDDDITDLICRYIKEFFGEENYSVNIKYIAESLGKKGTEFDEETIRKYMLNDFYSDHIKTYQKRPIYWMIDSGKKNGFKSFIYIHRYDKKLFSKMRVDYLHKTQNLYEQQKNELNYKLKNDSLEPTMRKNLQNELNDIVSKIDECNIFDEKLGHIANQMIDINLDDGVKANYDMFADILAKIK